MARYACIACGDPVEVDTRHLGPIAVQALLDPVTILGTDCVLRLHLEVHSEDDRQWLLYEGREYLEVGGAFARSDNTRVAHVYRHDQKQQRAHR